MTRARRRNATIYDWPYSPRDAGKYGGGRYMTYSDTGVRYDVHVIPARRGGSPRRYEAQADGEVLGVYKSMNAARSRIILHATADARPSRESRRRNPPKTIFYVAVRDRHGQEWPIPDTNRWTRAEADKDARSIRKGGGAPGKVVVRSRPAHDWERTRRVTSKARTGHHRVWSKYPGTPHESSGRFRTPRRAEVIAARLRKEGGKHWVEAPHSLEREMRKMHEHYEEYGNPRKRRRTRRRRRNPIPSPRVDAKLSGTLQQMGAFSPWHGDAAKIARLIRIMDRTKNRRVLVRAFERANQIVRDSRRKGVWLPADVVNSIGFSFGPAWERVTGESLHATTSKPKRRRRRRRRNQGRVPGYEFRVVGGHEDGYRTSYVTVAKVNRRGATRNMIQASEDLLRKYPHLTRSQVRYAGPTSLPYGAYDVI